MHSTWTDSEDWELQLVQSAATRLLMGASPSRYSSVISAALVPSLDPRHLKDHFLPHESAHPVSIVQSLPYVDPQQGLLNGGCYAVERGFLTLEVQPIPFLCLLSDIG